MRWRRLTENDSMPYPDHHPQLGAAGPGHHNLYPSKDTYSVLQQHAEVSLNQNKITSSMQQGAMVIPNPYQNTSKNTISSSDLVIPNSFQVTIPSSLLQESLVKHNTFPSRYEEQDLVNSTQIISPSSHEKQDLVNSTYIISPSSHEKQDLVNSTQNIFHSSHEKQKLLNFTKNTSPSSYEKQNLVNFSENISLSSHEKHDLVNFTKNTSPSSHEEQDLFNFTKKISLSSHDLQDLVHLTKNSTLSSNEQQDLVTKNTSLSGNMQHENLVNPSLYLSKKTNSSLEHQTMSNLNSNLAMVPANPPSSLKTVPCPGSLASLVHSKNNTMNPLSSVSKSSVLSIPWECEICAATIPWGLTLEQALHMEKHKNPKSS